MPTMPERPSKKAREIAARLNPLISQQKKKKSDISKKNRILLDRDGSANFRTPEGAI
ncbi:MAG: hypothetical protein PVF17_00420 [Ignavibacteria bacterium]|jgi:hypothetical protein